MDGRGGPRVSPLSPPPQSEPDVQISRIGLPSQRSPSRQFQMF
jgi:hypothetical protein